MLFSVATLTLTLGLAGCHGEHSEPTPVHELPELERSLAEVERRDGRLYVPEAAVAERRGLNQVFVLHEGEGSSGPARARQWRPG
jgi:streptomycin 6-kinase